MSESFALLYSALFCTIFKKHRVTGIILLSEIVQVKHNINVTYVPYYYHNIFSKRHMVVVGTHLKIFKVQKNGKKTMQFVIIKNDDNEFN